jgi:hypothetical protein
MLSARMHTMRGRALVVVKRRASERKPMTPAYSDDLRWLGGS